MSEGPRRIVRLLYLTLPVVLNTITNKRSQSENKFLKTSPFYSFFLQIPDLESLRQLWVDSQWSQLLCWCCSHACLFAYLQVLNPLQNFDALWSWLCQAKPGTFTFVTEFSTCLQPRSEWYVEHPVAICRPEIQVPNFANCSYTRLLNFMMWALGALALTST